MYLQLPLKSFLWCFSHCYGCRREQIVAKYPQVKTLFGPCPLLKYKVLVAVTIQLMGAFTFRNASWPLLLLFTYTLSGSCNHFLTLAMHELSHNLGFKAGFPNRVYSIITNFPLGIPAAM